LTPSLVSSNIDDPASPSWHFEAKRIPSPFISTSWKHLSMNTQKIPPFRPKRKTVFVNSVEGEGSILRVVSWKIGDLFKADRL
jgi:hypothetical protein